MTAARQSGSFRLGMPARIVVWVIIVLGGLVAAVQLLTPLMARWPQPVVALVGKVLEQPVSAESASGHWHWSGPSLRFDGVRLGAGDRVTGKAVALDSVDLKLDLGAWSSSARHWLMVRLDGLKLDVRRDADGHWQVVGIRSKDFDLEKLEKLAALSIDLVLDDVQLTIDLGGGHPMVLHVNDLHVRTHDGRVRFVARAGTDMHDTPVKVRGDVDFAGRTGKLWAGIPDIGHAGLLQGLQPDGVALLAGNGSAQFWLAWSPDEAPRVLAKVDARDVVLVRDNRAVLVPHLAGIGRYRWSASGWRIDYAADDAGRLALQATRVGDRESMAAVMRDMQVGPWLQLAALSPAVGDGLRRWLHATQPRVHVDDARLWRSADGVTSGTLDFDHLSMANDGYSPGIDRLDGRLAMTGDTVELTLPPQPVAFDFGSLFRQPLAVGRLAGSVIAKHEGNDWIIATRRMDFAGPGYAGSGHGSVTLPGDGQSPLLDLHAALDYGNVAMARRYWPTGVLSPDLVTWLDDALVGGTVTSASFTLQGRATDWPYVKGGGTFSIEADVVDGKLDYMTGWPQASGIKATADFTGDGMTITASTGQVSGVHATRATARIEHFDETDLELGVAGYGTLKNMLAFLAGSPIGADQRDVLEALDTRGSASYKLNLNVPLSDNDKALPTLSGQAVLKDDAVGNPAWGVSFEGLGGTVHFDENGLRGSGLRAKLHGQPVTVGLQIASVEHHPTWPIRVDVQGDFTLAQLARGYPSLDDLTAMGHGTARFDASFHIDPDGSNPLHAKQLLTIGSNLRGIRIDAPAPLGKPATTSVPLSILVGIDEKAMPVRVDLGKALRVRASVPATGKGQPRIGVTLGRDGSVTVPARGLAVNGRVLSMDMAGWIAWAARQHDAGDGPPMPLDIDVATSHAMLAGQDFGALQVHVGRRAGRVVVNLHGPRMAGSASVPGSSGSRSPVIVHLKRWYWPAMDLSKATADHDRTGANSTRQNKPTPDIAPADFPALRVLVDDLRLGSNQLGVLRVTATSSPGRWRLDDFSVDAGTLRVKASGAWSGTAAISRTHFKTVLDSPDLGAILAGYGLTNVLTGGKTHATLDASWPGGPLAFAAAGLAGDFKFTVTDGAIPELKPGVGRVFGLLSVAALPRRLLLDFGDVFGKGLGFDSIDGAFRFGNGFATTKGVRVDASAADMLITGKLNLVNETYDQYVQVSPHVGNGLPVVGAAVGGPIGAAAGLALQGLFGSALGKMAGSRYHVTGPWDNPVVKKLN